MRRVTVLLLAFYLSGCAWFRANEGTIISDIDKALPIACEVVQTADPSMATLVCALLDTAGAVLDEIPPKTMPTDHAVAYAAAHPGLRAALRRTLSPATDKGVSRL